MLIWHDAWFEHLRLTLFSIRTKTEAFALIGGNFCPTTLVALVGKFVHVKFALFETWRPGLSVQVTEHQRNALGVKRIWV